MAFHRNGNLRLTWKLTWIHKSKRTLASLPCKSIRNRMGEKKRKEKSVRDKRIFRQAREEKIHMKMKRGGQ